MARSDTVSRSTSNGRAANPTEHGRSVLRDPLLNRGTAFTSEERAALGLDGLVPPGISTLEEQAER